MPNETKSTLSKALEAGKNGFVEGWNNSEDAQRAKALLCARIQKLRLDRDLKQTDVAEAVKVNRFTYCGYEVGRAEPNASIIVRIADYYNVSLDYLFGRTDNPNGMRVNDDREKESIREELKRMQEQIEQLKNKID
ncbi:MAG: helix-turn-helix domain-containing protein [Eubacteriales bacterium]